MAFIKVLFCLVGMTTLALADSDRRFQVDMSAVGQLNDAPIYAKDIKSKSPERDRVLTAMKQSQGGLTCLKSFTDFITSNGAEISKWAKSNDTIPVVSLQFGNTMDGSVYGCKLFFGFNKDSNIYEASLMRTAKGWTSAELNEALDKAKKYKFDHDKAVEAKAKVQKDNEGQQQFDSTVGRLQNYLETPAH